MISAKRKKRSVRVSVKLVLMIFADLAGLAALLLTFAYFHHVKPRVLIYEEMVIPRPESTIPKDESGMWGEKFADKFIDSDEPETYVSPDKKLRTYVSRDINLKIDKISENGITYFIADFYIRNIDNFMTAFANDTYGKSIIQPIEEMSSAKNAVLATNGDYYGIRDYGICIRNGILYRTDTFADVCVLYYDGVLKTYKKRDFSLTNAVKDGAYQVWSFGPELLHDGETVSEFSWSIQSENPRCAIGYFEPGHYCLIVIDGRQPGYSDGMTFQDMSVMFKNLGCTAAYNMDGGQSAKMTFMSKLVNHPTVGGRDTSDMIYIGEISGNKVSDK